MHSEKSDTMPRTFVPVKTLGDLRRLIAPFDDEMQVFAGEPSDTAEPAVQLILVRKRVGGLQAPWEYLMCFSEADR